MFMSAFEWFVYISACMFWFQIVGVFGYVAWAVIKDIKIKNNPNYRY